eukprot:5000950-Karenia_brevis.AAC.1
MVQSCVSSCMDLRTAILDIDHVPTELVLTRQCADVSKLMYHLRINGDRIDHDLLDRFDHNLRSSIETALGGELPDTS